MTSLSAISDAICSFEMVSEITGFSTQCQRLHTSFLHSSGRGQGWFVCVRSLAGLGRRLRGTRERVGRKFSACALAHKEEAPARREVEGRRVEEGFNDGIVRPLTGSLLFFSLQRMIMSRTIGDLFCDNMPQMVQIQEKVLSVSSPSNPVRDCNDPTRSKIDFHALNKRRARRRRKGLYGLFSRDVFADGGGGGGGGVCAALLQSQIEQWRQRRGEATANFLHLLPPLTLSYRGNRIKSTIQRGTRNVLYWAAHPRGKRGPFFVKN